MNNPKIKTKIENYITLDIKTIIIFPKIFYIDL